MTDVVSVYDERNREIYRLKLQHSPEVSWKQWRVKVFKRYGISSDIWREDRTRRFHSRKGAESWMGWFKDVNGSKENTWKDV